VPVDIVGWCYDPYGVHEQRWFSDGTPTRLVRDGGIVSNDPPPPTKPCVSVIPVTYPDRTDGSDLRRADDARTYRVAASRPRWRPRSTQRS